MKLPSDKHRYYKQASADTRYLFKGISSLHRFSKPTLREERNMMDVFIVENSMAIRVGLQAVLSDMSAIKIIGHAVNEKNAIERIGMLQPDVVILDLGLQSGTGIGVLENVKKCHAEIKVIVFTHYTDESCIERCKRAGADYFFDKSFQLMQLREILWKWAHTDRLDNQFRLSRQFDIAQHLSS